MKNLKHACYNLVLALWIGGISIFTFLVTPAVFGSFERDMAGKIVGVVFPGYFAYLLVLSISALVLLLLLRPFFSKFRYKLSLGLVVFAVIINLFVAFWLHPEIRKVKHEIHSIGNTADDSSLRKLFGRFHAVSATLNLLILADGITLLVLGSGLERREGEGSDIEV